MSQRQSVRPSCGGRSEHFAGAWCYGHRRESASRSIDQLVERGLVNDMADLYCTDRAQTLESARSDGEESRRRTWLPQIERSKGNELWRLYCSASGSGMLARARGRCWHGRFGSHRGADGGVARGAGSGRARRRPGRRGVPPHLPSMNPAKSSIYWTGCARPVSRWRSRTSKRPCARTPHLAGQTFVLDRHVVVDLPSTRRRAPCHRVTLGGKVTSRRSSRRRAIVIARRRPGQQVRQGGGTGGANAR